jgi:molybdate/tungstate transport system substrate-binding protein
MEVCTMEKVRTTAIIVLVFLLACASVWAEGAQETGSTAEWQKVSGVLTIFHAGSLSVPFEAMEKEVEHMYPDLDIQREAAGSTASARKISELGKPADIMASADYTVIDKILIPDYATLNIRFATNQLVLCYTDSSRYANEVNSDN